MPNPGLVPPRQLPAFARLMLRGATPADPQEALGVAPRPRSPEDSFAAFDVREASAVDDRAGDRSEAWQIRVREDDDRERAA